MEKYLNDFEVQHRNPSEEALRRWRSSVSVVKNRRPRFSMVADLDKRSQAEKKRLDDETVSTVESSKTEISLPIETEANSIGDKRQHGERNTSWISSKANLETILVIINFVVELPSIVFDQLSSVHKPQYALLSMLMSYLALITCIAEFIYEIRKDKVTWKWCPFPWFYHPSETHKPFGNFKGIVGLVCALCQCIFTTTAFGFIHRHADSPIKISVLPVIFASGILCSKFLEKPEM